MMDIMSDLTTVDFGAAAIHLFPTAYQHMLECNALSQDCSPHPPLHRTIAQAQRIGNP
jgi:hypothetical protein